MTNHHEILVGYVNAQQGVLKWCWWDLFSFVALCSRAGPLPGAVVMTIRKVLQERCLLSNRTLQTMWHYTFIANKAFLRSLINLFDIHMVTLLVEAGELFTFGILFEHLDVLVNWLDRVHSWCWFVCIFLNILILKKLSHIEFHLRILSWTTKLPWFNFF